jgi:hypothetical protein
VAAVLFAYSAYDMSDDVAVPSIQGEGQFQGMGIDSGVRFGEGTPLDMRPDVHQWHPGYDPDPYSQPVMQSRHRYPVVPGGNISSVMHQGWSQFCQNSPADNDWRLNPPEAAVL